MNRLSDSDLWYLRLKTADVCRFTAGVSFFFITILKLLQIYNVFF